MLNRLLWLQRHLAKPSQAHFTRSRSIDVSTYAYQHTTLGIRVRRYATSIVRLQQTKPPILQQSTTSDSVEQYEHHHAASLQPLPQHETKVEDSLRSQSAPQASSAPDHRVLSNRSNSRVNASTTSSNVSEAQDIKARPGQYLRKTRRTAHHGTSKDRARHALQMVLFHDHKKRQKLWDAHGQRQLVKLVRDSYATSIRNKPASTVDEEELESNVYLQYRRRRSPLHRGGFVNELEPFLPYWTVASSKITGHHTRQGKILVDKDLIFSFESFILRRFRIPRRTLLHRLGYIWKKLGPRLQRRFWMSALLYGLHHRPIGAAKILNNIRKRRAYHIPAYISQDCIHHIFRALLLPSRDRDGTELFPSHDHIRMCWRLFQDHRAKYTNRTGFASLKSESVNLLLRYLNFKTFETFISKYSIDVLYYAWSTDNIRQIVYRYIKEGEVEKALQWLTRLPDEEKDVDRTLELCVWFLRYDFEVDRDKIYRLRTNILSHMLEIGIRFNRQMHNVVILNAMEAGDRQTAWSSHNIVLQNGMLPNAFTYSILLKGVEWGDSIDSLSSVYQDAKNDGVLHQSPHLGAHMVHALHELDKLQARPQPFKRMLNLYAQLFDLTPLQDVGLALGAEQSNPLGTELMRPPVHVLGSMVMAWLQENFDADHLDDVFEKYLQHVAHQSSRIAITAHYRYIFNSFIIAFSKRRGSLRQCTRIVQIMSNPDRWLNKRRWESKTVYKYVRDSLPYNMKVTARERVRHETPAVQREEKLARHWYIKIAQPDSRTWNILLYAFIRNGETETAEHIVDMMKHFGIPRDSVTWNSLISGYARLQYIDGVVQSIQRQGDAGFEPDNFTLNALNRVMNRRSLLDAFENVEENLASEEGV